MYHRGETIIVDFQYLHGNKKQIFIKELAIMEANNIGITNYHFLPPFSSKELNEQCRSTNEYCEKNINFLRWDDGILPYTQLEEIMCELEMSGRTIIVQTEWKKRFLDRYLTRVQVIEAMPGFNYHFKYGHPCPTHLFNQTRCSTLHVFLIFLYMEKHCYFV